jgi:hypothetical protein
MKLVRNYSSHKNIYVIKFYASNSIFQNTKFKQSQFTDRHNLHVALQKGLYPISVTCFWKRNSATQLRNTCMQLEFAAKLCGIFKRNLPKGDYHRSRFHTNQTEVYQPRSPPSPLSAVLISSSLWRKGWFLKWNVKFCEKGIQCLVTQYVNEVTVCVNDPSRSLGIILR